MLRWLRRWHRLMLWAPQPCDEQLRADLMLILQAHRESIDAQMQQQRSDFYFRLNALDHEGRLKELERRLYAIEKKVDKMALFDGHG